MSLFRKKALDSLSTPENLKEPMQLLSPGFWSILITSIGFGSFILLWSIFGRLPMRIKGQGILYHPDSIYLSQPKVSARVKYVSVKAGDCVVKGEILAGLDLNELELSKNKIQNLLIKLTDDSRLETELESSQLKLKEKELNRYSELLKNGAVSKMKFEKIELEFNSLMTQVTKERIKREQSILDQKLELKKLDDQINSSSLITAKFDGCIIDSNVKVGQIVNPGDRIFELKTQFKNSSLTSYAFLATKDAKRIKIGQLVQVTPTTTKKQRHGGIRGSVTSINLLPISKEALFTKFGNEIVVSKLLKSKSEPMIQIITSLDKDENSISGYDWGGGKGPNLYLSSGTMTNISIIVERRRPITYVIPLLRDLSGIY